MFADRVNSCTKNLCESVGGGKSDNKTFYEMLFYTYTS